MNSIFGSNTPANAEYSEVINAINEDFSAACTLFERSPAMQNPLLRDCYVKILDQVIPGDIPVEQAVEMILELAA